MPLDTCAASYFRPSSKPQAARLCALNAAGSCASGGLHDCPVDPATVSPPSPPSPPPPVTAIPAEGVKVLSGGNAEATLVKCMWPGDEQVTTADHGRKTIAAQCCEADGTCRRQVDGTCVAGKSTRGTEGSGIEPMTFGEAVAKCAQLNLELCDRSCAGSGCNYNSHPVWSRLPCDPSPSAVSIASQSADVAKPPPASPPPPLPTAVGAFDGAGASLIPIGLAAAVMPLGLVAGFVYRRRRLSHGGATSSTASGGSVAQPTQLGSDAAGSVADTIQRFSADL